jgi:hypothetical protein
MRLFTYDYPNYFHAPGLSAWWGDPIRWEIAVLIIAVISAAALFLPCRRTRVPLFVASAIAAPFIFGLVATVFQIHMIFYTLSRSGWAGVKGIGPGLNPWEDHIFCSLFSSHIGLFSSIALMLIWFGAKLFLVRGDPLTRSP